MNTTENQAPRISLNRLILPSTGTVIKGTADDRLRENDDLKRSKSFPLVCRQQLLHLEQ